VGRIRLDGGILGNLLRRLGDRHAVNADEAGLDGSARTRPTLEQAEFHKYAICPIFHLCSLA